MKILISYFYMIRFFTPDMIPLSTAKWDPKWYHNSKTQDDIFVDARGVLNGLRAPVFAPGELALAVSDCGPQCSKEPNTCNFLRAYEFQLNQLDFKDIQQRIENICNKAANFLHLEKEPIPVLIVHEAPNNPCSERDIIKKWFKQYNIDIEEFNPNDLLKR